MASEEKPKKVEAQKPSVGRIVHYGLDRLEDGSIRPIAAIVAFVHEDGTTINGGAFLPSGIQYGIAKAPYSEELAWGCWSWPPKA
jgi:hypothetical protein